MSLLTCQQLVVDIPGRAEVQPLDLAVEGGELWGVLGPNGAGKTTLLHSLAGLRPPRSGAITVAGRALSDWRKRSLAQQLGVLFQQPSSAMEMSVFESALAGRYPWLSRWQRESSTDHQRVYDALAAVGLNQRARQRVATLSGGERQRLDIATLMVQDPALWLLDEPTNHLDMHQQQRVLQLLRQYAQQGKGVVMTLHDVNLAARWCSHLMLLFDDGSLYAGPRDALLDTERLSRLYHQRLRRLDVDGQAFFLPI
ncbi:ABC transporter ATP-binding protein [Carnimonas bestiolae]|uniref:ABC transporter ATP-binding protein n=1 Tax=Carnimonas bestiolae TaxID=3402172 RepID=UPI003EDBFA54